jgi:hypothetical protein
MTLEVNNDGRVSGTYKATTGGHGNVSGKLEGKAFSFVLSQTTADCPATYIGSITLEGVGGAGTYVGTSCLGKHENGVVSMVRDSQEPVGKEPIQGSTLVKSETTSVANSETVPPEVVAERRRRDTECPGCPGLLLYYVDADNGQRQTWWLTNDQREWLQKQREEAQKKGKKNRFLFTNYEANADYLIFWTQAEGSRPYVYYVPRTVTENAQVSGSYNTYGTGGSTWGTYNGTVRVQRTYNERVEGQRNYVNVVMTVYDARTGKKVYETWHQGNWIWSKPWKDCLVDTIKFLRQLHP